MEELNYHAIQRDLIKPVMESLDPDIHRLLELITETTEKLSQDSRCLPPECEEATNLLHSIDAERLCHAAAVIYYWGHFSFEDYADLKYGNMKPERFYADFHDVFGLRRKVKERIKALDSFFGRQKDCEVTITYHRLGMDNEKTVGVYWKFEQLVKHEMVRRNASPRPPSLEELFPQIPLDYYVHKPGTSYTVGESRKELYRVFKQNQADYPLLLAAQSGFNIVTRYKDHPPVVGRRTFRDLGSSMTIGPDATCDLCGDRMDRHLSTKSLVFQLDKWQGNVNGEEISLEKLEEEVSRLKMSIAAIAERDKIVNLQVYLTDHKNKDKAKIVIDTDFITECEPV